MKGVCLICKEPTDTPTGWHLMNGLEFCSNQCVAKYLESLCDTAFVMEYE